MKEFEDFLIEGIVKKQYPDKQRAKDLIGEANRKFKVLKMGIEKREIDDENSNDIVEDCHDIILGLIRAKMLLKGFGASGQGAHEAEVAYLGKLKFTEQEIDFVNKLRYFRNGIMYYGKRFDKEYAKKALDFLYKFKEKIKPFAIIIRGPLGVGKTTIAKMLAEDLEGEYFLIDSVLEQHGLDKVDEKEGYIPLINFIKVNQKLLPKIKEAIENNKIAIIEGNLYHKEQLDDLIKKIKNLGEIKFYVFTLKVSLQTCIERDKKRKNSYGKQAVEEVYKKVNEFDYGTSIDTKNKTKEEIASEMKKRIG